MEHPVFDVVVLVQSVEYSSVDILGSIVLRIRVLMVIHTHVSQIADLLLFGVLEVDLQPALFDGDGLDGQELRLDHVTVLLEVTFRKHCKLEFVVRHVEEVFRQDKSGIKLTLGTVQLVSHGGVAGLALVPGHEVEHEVVAQVLGGEHHQVGQLQTAVQRRQCFLLAGQLHLLQHRQGLLAAVVAQCRADVLGLVHRVGEVEAALGFVLQILVYVVVHELTLLDLAGRHWDQVQ